MLEGAVVRIKRKGAWTARLALVVGMGVALLQASAAPAEVAAGDWYESSISHPSFVSPHAQPIAVHGNNVFVVNTPSDTLDVIDRDSRQVTARINVGVDPVSVAVRPDGHEVWVSNHVSDSVSIVDNNALSPTYLQIVATIQTFDRERKATSFDEPMGIAFAGNEKAYIALSSDNHIAVVDVSSRSVIKRLRITAQDPRAIEVRNGKLYVLPFESNNKTQLSGGMKSAIDGDLVTFDAVAHSIVSNSKLSLGHVIDIVKHPDMPDRDLYIFDTETDELIETANTLGTLLYGLTIDSKGNVFIAQTDARNDANGRAGTQKHGLAEMENRAFLNRVTKVNTQGAGVPARTFFDLEPLPPQQPLPGRALATPYGIRVSDDDSTLVVTAAGSDKLVTIDAASGEVLGRVEVDAVPRGVALVSDAAGRPEQAWVLNAVENTVSLVDVANKKAPKLSARIVLHDPTSPLLKQGRKAFETAEASSTGTFACASCHPDGHTDQLLWVLNTPIVTGGDQIQPRTTMPIRGLRDTEPFHWDGIPGDPYGGHNAANTDSYVAPNSDINDPTTATRNLIDASLANTMRLLGVTNTNDEGKVGLLSAAERDALALFLLNVPYPPAQRRPYDNVPSDRAKDGFRLFHIDGNGVGRRDVCGDCHRFPHMVSTNHPTIGMDTPTWRGAYDRFLILPQGRINMVTLPPFAKLAEQGIPERELWRFSWGLRDEFDPVWDMVLEHSTGFSGSFARQVTLSKQSLAEDTTIDLLAALEQSAREEAIQLVGNGMFLGSEKPQSEALFFDGSAYVTKTRRYARDELFDMAESGSFVATLTAHKGTNAGADQAQPAIWTLGPIEQQNGPQRFPKLHSEQSSITVSGRHIPEDAFVIVDGRRVAGSVSARGNEVLEIAFAKIPDEGMHLLQVQTPGGLMSNDFIFHVTNGAEQPDRPTLGELIQRSGWEDLIGDWVDVGTRGEFRLSLSWKIKNQLLELVTMDQNGPAVALIRIEQGTGRIVHSGSNHSGVSNTGQWDFAAKEGPKMAGSFVSNTGVASEFTMQLVLKSRDTLVLRLGAAQLSEIPMMRKQVARNTLSLL